MFESAWDTNMGQFLFHLNPDTRKETRRLERIQIKIIKYVYIYIYIYIYIYTHTSIYIKKRNMLVN